jgi:hypothetical protein
VRGDSKEEEGVTQVVDEDRLSRIVSKVQVARNHQQLFRNELVLFVLLHDLAKHGSFWQNFFQLLFILLKNNKNKEVLLELLEWKDWFLVPLCP